MKNADGLRRYAVPVDGRPLRLAVGTRAIPASEWLLLGEDRDRQLARKRELFTERKHEVLAGLPESSEACREAAAVVTEAVGGPRPREVVALEALGAASLLVQEDLCLMVRGRAEWVLAAASLCFPSHWALVAKLGQGMNDIHASVPGYTERLARASEAAMDRLARSGSVSADPQVYERFNWTLSVGDELFRPAPHLSRQLAVGEVGDQVRLRVERQTLRYLPESGGILFGIRTFLTPLAALDRGERSALAQSLQAVSPELVHYRGWFGYFGAVRAWLDTPDGG